MRPSSLLIAFLMALAAVSPAGALERILDISNDRWVEVTGEGSFSAAPDFARVTVGVTSAGRNAGEAMAANARAANALISLIKAEGVAPADIQTSDVSISPTFSQSSPGQTSSPTITGYSVSNNVTVNVRDISRLGSLLDKAVAAGANSIYGIGFGHNNPSALLDKARPLAVADARRKAEIYAGAGRRPGWSAHGAYGGRREPSARGVFPRVLWGLTGPAADRGGRGPTYRDCHRAIRTDPVNARSPLISFQLDEAPMCRNIRPLFNFEPPATEAEIRASALQFVRKVSGFAKPSQGNAEAFERAVDEVSEAARKLISSLHSAAPPRDRDVEARKARERSRLRFG